jgi:hypothetical protein
MRKSLANNAKVPGYPCHIYPWLRSFAKLYDPFCALSFGYISHLILIPAL